AQRQPGGRLQPVPGGERVLRSAGRLLTETSFGKGLGVTSNDCPVCATAEGVCAKWTLLRVRDLAEGCSRFCELEPSLEGISPRALSLRLRALEEEGIVERQTYPEVPPRVEYALTAQGEALVPLIDDMRAYGTRWLLTEAGEPAAV